MKTVHKARPQYPTYRSTEGMTARHPVIELVLAVLVIGMLLAAGLSLINVVNV